VRLHSKPSRSSPGVGARDDGLRIIDIVRAEMAKDLSAALATPRPPGAGLDATAFIDTIEALWTARWRL
jgi:hypothetical protein